MLITQQSKKEFFNILENESERSLVVTISPQVRASIAEYYKISTKEVQNYLSFSFIWFFTNVINIRLFKDLQLCLNN